MSMMIHRSRKRKKQREISHEENLPFSDSDIQFEEREEEQQYTKTDIQRMNKAELQELARNSGVEGADEMTGQELKDYLLNVFGL